jgi:hypothetical protein
LKTTSFYKVLIAEIHKGRNSFAVWLSLAGTVANAVMLFALMWWDQAKWEESSFENPWQTYVVGHYEGIAFMMLPLYVIILASLVTFMEHRRQMWVQLNTLPVERWKIYQAKQLYILLLFIAAHVLFIFAFLFTGCLLGLVKPETGLLQHWPDGVQILELAGKTVFSILALLSLQYGLSLKFRHFIIPLTIGILGFVLASLLGPGWNYAFLNPYAYPIHFMPEYLGEIKQGGAEFWGMNIIFVLVFNIVFFKLK